MVDEYSVTILQGSHQQHSVTQLWRNTVPGGILHKNLISPVHLHNSTVYCYCFWWNWQNTEQNVQYSSLSLYRQTVYSGKYSGHCVVLVLLIEWLLFIIR
jgi:hypothetical protein